MKNFHAAKKIAAAALSLLLSGIFMTFAYLLCIFLGMYRLPVAIIAAGTATLAAILFFAGIMEKKRAALSVFSVLAVLLAGSCGIYTMSLGHFMSGGAYMAPSAEREMFKGKNIMILVPHQDDEMNILSGVIEQYTAAGSKVSVVYSTNGDYEVSAEIRYTEALSLLENLGIDRENVYFLGYGDSWKDGHLYNAKPDQLKQSHIGRTETYGSGGIEPYGGIKPCTRENFRSDVKNVILELRPELIYCIDYDSHQDHRALSLMFEEVMGEILREEDYRPLVLKAFAYSTAWFADKDYHRAYNLQSTKNKYETDHMQENNIYLWSERLRLPVDAAKLARYVENSGIYKDLALFESQRTINMAESVINSDKVMWQRETDSLLYKAKIEVSSGDGSLLNNFMLTDSKDILSDSMPFDGTWIPQDNDSEKRIRVSLGREEYIKRIKIYDSPSLEHNVLSVRIDFDDGSSIEVPALEKNGSATEIPVEKNVSAFSICVLDSQGDMAGLTEIEAYSEERRQPFSYIKLVSENDDFVYDCVTNDGQLSLGVYSPAFSDSLDGKNYQISWDNPDFNAEFTKDGIIVSCPKGEECELKLTHIESGESDSIRIYRMSSLEKLRLAIEKKMYEKYTGCLNEQIGRVGKTLDKSSIGAITTVARMNILNIG